MNLKNIIYILGIGDIKSSILLSLQRDLVSSFKKFIADVEILHDLIPLELSEYHTDRRQYDASMIKKKLKNKIGQETYFRILGVIDEDIFTKNLNFVFGIAEIPRKPFIKSTNIALISVARLRENFYRRPKNNALFELRTKKEAIHELGHTFGLDHCDNYCVMKFSNSLADTDQKPEEFCDTCCKKVELFFSTQKNSA
jgi:archaemetzincin